MSLIIINLLLLLSLTSLVQADTTPDINNSSKPSLKQKQIMGWVEYAYLLPWYIKTKVKLDTGAKTSSLHAKHITYFERNGDPWVRFTIYFSDKNGHSIQKELEKPLIRNTKIKEHQNYSQKRPVIELSLQIGDQIHPIEFSLTDRSNFIYPILLGRSILKHIAIIDSSKTFLIKLPKVNTVNSPNSSNQELSKDIPLKSKASTSLISDQSNIMQ